MRYKILLAGNNDTIINDFFSQLDDRVEFLTTSLRRDDILTHITYFQPDILCYCGYNETWESVNKIAMLKQRLDEEDIAVAVTGAEEDLNVFLREGFAVANLTIPKPQRSSEIVDRIVKYMEETGRAARKQMEAGLLATMPQPRAAQTRTPFTQAGAAAQAQAGTPFTQAGAAAQAQTGTPFTQAGAAAQAQAGTPFTQAGAAAQAQAGTPFTQAGTAAQAQTGTPFTQAGTAAQAQAGATPHMAQAAQDQPQPTGSAPDASPHINPSSLLHEVNAFFDSHERKHILVIDDNPTMLKVIQDHLHEEYEVATAISARVARRFLSNKKTDLILLDYEMPDTDGPSLLAELRKSPATKDIPVIFVTGATERHKIAQALVMKPQGYLLKPIDRGKLLAAINKVLRGPENGK